MKKIRKKRATKVIPISKCIKTTWSYQNFKVTGHPYWELWNEILHAVAPIVEKNKLEREKNDQQKNKS